MENEGTSRRKKKGKRPVERPVEAAIPQAPQPGLAPVSDHSRAFDYPFHKKVHMTAEMRKVEAVVKDLPVLNPIYPDIGTLVAYDLLEPVRNYFVSVGLDFVFYMNPGVFEMMVREFFYSFRATIRMVKKSDSESGVVEKYVEGWKFQLGGRDWALTRTDLRQAFVVRDELVKFPHCPDNTWSTFWREITGLDEEFVGSKTSSKIKVPVWRMVHRLIATCVYLRPDGGRFVTNKDYTLMCCMRAKVPIDPIIILTKAVSVTKISRGMSIGGGHIISLLAIYLGFSLGHGTPFPRKVLGEEELLRRGILKQVRTPSGIKTVLASGDPRAEEATVPLSPTQAQDQPGSSSMPEAAAGYDDLVSMMRALTTFNQEGLRWQGDMMRNLHSQLNLTGFVEPPCYRPPAGGYGYDGAETNEPEGEDMEEDENPDA